MSRPAESGRVVAELEDLILLRAEARGFSLQSCQPVGSLLAGRHASRLRGRGLSFRELRAYHPGDDIRTMDWKATARLRSPQVRVYDEERERPVLLVVDQRSPMFFGSRRAMKSVAAAEVAALGAWCVFEAGDRVGGLVFNENEIAEVRPHRSRNRVLQLLHEIVRKNQSLATGFAADGGVTLNDALRAALQLAKHDHLIVLISDLDGADDETERLATRLASHNDMLVLGVYDPLGVSLAGAPGMVASDRGSDWAIPADPTFTDRFRSAFERLLNKWRETFRNLRIPVLPITTAEPVAQQVRSALGNQRPAR